MPVIESVKKALRQNKKRRVRNLQYKNKIKTLSKKASILVQAGKREELLKLTPALYKAIDKAAKVGVLKKKTADRRKSRVARMAALKKNSEQSTAVTPPQKS